MTRETIRPWRISIRKEDRGILIVSDNEEGFHEIICVCHEIDNAKIIISAVNNITKGDK